jgi:N-methylhydantoinase A/oxoprolinase/acetone carboxylase beta subunit
MRTLGLGGDSRIARRDGRIEIGPQRIAPVAWLAAHAPGTRAALDWLERRLDRFDRSTHGMELLSLTPYEHRPLRDEEARVVDPLRDGPMTVDELVERLRCGSEHFLPLAALEEAHIVHRCGLTPTDLLHASGRLNLWNAEASGWVCDLYARALGMNRSDMIDQMVSRFVRLLALELLEKQMSDELEDDTLENSPAAMALIGRALGDRADDYSVRIGLHQPVIGIGAPAHFFLPQAAKLLHTEAIVPEHADVANALGAIASPVRIRRRATIGIDENGKYRVEGLPEAPPSFARLDDAQDWAIQRLGSLVRGLGQRAGTAQSKVDVSLRDRMAAIKDGNQLFIARVIEAQLTGRPDVARLVT